MKRTIALVMSASCFGIPAANAVLIDSNWDPVNGLVEPARTEIIVGATRADFSSTPGQAMSWQGVDVVSTNAVFANTTTCLIPVPSCGSGGPATLATSLSVGGLQGEYVGSAGSDLATSALALSGSFDGSLPSSPFFGGSLFRSGGMDYQRLFVATDAAVETVLIDIEYSVFAEVTQHVPQNLQARASAGVLVGEASTRKDFLGVPDTGPFGLSTLDLAFLAFANAGNLFDAASAVDSAIDATGTFAIRPNTEYWVMLVAAENILFTGPTNVDLTMSSFVDPVFSINEAWLAQFGGSSPRISIERTVNVPEPSTLGLLGAGLLAALRRRRVFRPS